MYLFLTLFLLLMGYFVYFQVVESERFINNPYNSLQDQFSKTVTRGKLYSADKQVLAESQLDENGNEVRVYPYGNQYAHVVGFAVNGKSGLEKEENFSLLRSHQFFLEQIKNGFEAKKNLGDNVVTTLNSKMQEAAYAALGDYDGAVIAIEPKTGKILTMVSKPDFNPNTIAQDWDSVSGEGSTALFNRATQGQYAPGSVFKIFTALEYYNENSTSWENYFYVCNGENTVDGKTLKCAGHKKHGEEDLTASFAQSCNASFSNIGLTLNREAFAKKNQELLFNQELPISFPSSKSQFALTETDDVAMVMETSIGQGKTLVSPLHMCLVASAIANEGVLMKPYLVDHTENVDGVEVIAYSPEEYKKLFTKAECDFLNPLLDAVVRNGTATLLGRDGYDVYGKTGTAQVSDNASDDNSWFVGYSSRDNKDKIAIAVVVEKAGGSAYATKVTKRVLDAYYN